MKRALAVLAATAMIVGALWYRGVFDSDGATSASGDPERPTRILCASELEAVCMTAFSRTAEITLLDAEAPGLTADSLSKADPEWDVWVVSEPWAGIAESRAETAGRSLDLQVSKPIASQPLRLMTASAAKIDCPAGDVACALRSGRAAGIRPATTTGGVIAAVAVAAGVLGLDDFATNDLDDGTVEQALAAIADSADQDPDPVNKLLTRAGAFGAVADIGAVVPSGRANRATVTDAVPSRNALAVIVSRADRKEPDTALATELTVAMNGTPWRPVTTNPPPAGLPKPAVVDAVARLWAPATR